VSAGTGRLALKRQAETKERAMRDLTTALKVNRAYEITYECRDIGYGVESGIAEFVYRGRTDALAGKHEFTPVGGGPTIYLFPDEITNVD
jgi:hypothetical protein